MLYAIFSLELVVKLQMTAMSIIHHWFNKIAVPRAQIILAGRRNWREIIAWAVVTHVNWSVYYLRAEHL